jgi:hypothetical protein
MFFNSIFFSISFSISYPDKIGQVLIREDTEKGIVELLEKVFKEPTLTEREKMILSAINNGQQEKIEESKTVFENNETKICPYCFQSVSETYKRELVNSINTILNKEVDEHLKNYPKIENNDVYILNTEDDAAIDELNSKMSKSILAIQAIQEKGMSALNMDGQQNSGKVSNDSSANSTEQKTNEFQESATTKGKQNRTAQQDSASDVSQSLSYAGGC